MANLHLQTSTIEKIIKLVAVIGALGMAVFGVLGLFSPEQLAPDMNESAALLARYMGARNISIAAILVYLTLKFEKRVLGYFLLLMGIIQSFDSIFGIMEGKLEATIPPLVLTVAFFLSARYLLRRSKPS